VRVKLNQGCPFLLLEGKGSGFPQNTCWTRGPASDELKEKAELELSKTGDH